MFYEAVFPNNENGLTRSQPFIIKAERKDSAECAPAFLYPDCSGVEVKDTNDVFVINDLISDALPINKGEIVIFGFPGANSYKADSGLFARPASSISTMKYDLNSSSIIKDLRGELSVDTINYRIHMRDYKITSPLEGYSGSPVFIKDSDTDKWIFLGLFAASNVQLNTVYVVKSNLVLTEIFKHFN